MPSLKTRVQWSLLQQQAALDAKAEQADLDATSGDVEIIDGQIVVIGLTLEDFEERITNLEAP